MKRKIKRYDGGGNVVRTRTDDEIAEDSKFGGYGRYMPKTKEYSLDEVKGKLSGLFGGSSGDSSKFSELESVGGPGRRARSIEEQIGRKAESKAEEPSRKTEDSKASGPFSNVEAAVKSATSRDTESSAPAPVKKAMKVAEKAEPKKAALKKEEAEPKKSRPLAFKEAESKFVKEGEKLGSQGSFKFDSTPKKAPVTRYKKKEEEAAPVKAPKSKMDVEPEEMPKAASKAMKDSTQYKTKYGDFSFQKGFKKDEEKPEKKIRSAADIRAGRYKSGGSVSSASKRADGIAVRGKTKGRIY